MTSKSAITWTDATWSPVIGCTKVSQGCKHCYAEREVETRWSKNPKSIWFGRDFGDVLCRPDALSGPDGPMSWKKPRRIFVCPRADLFHEAVPDDFIDKVFAVMALCPQHTFQILTKRPERMRDYVTRLGQVDELPGGHRITDAVNFALLRSGKDWGKCGGTATAITTISSRTGAREPYMLRRQEDGQVYRLTAWSIEEHRRTERWSPCAPDFADRVWDFTPADFGWGLKAWPLPNVWLGVSIEDQSSADQRIPPLLETPAAIRWVSAEPLLGPVDLRNIAVPREHDALRRSWDFEGYKFNALQDHDDDRFHQAPATLDWVVVGGESGPKARPMLPAWAILLRAQCASAGVPFLHKQNGEWLPASQLPADLLLPAEHWGLVDVLTGEFNTRAQPGSEGQQPLRVIMGRVGIRKAGRLLDGVLHDGYPGDAA